MFGTSAFGLGDGSWQPQNKLSFSHVLPILRISIYACPLRSSADLVVFESLPSVQISRQKRGQLKGQLDANFLTFHSRVRFPPPPIPDFRGRQWTSVDLREQASTRSSLRKFDSGI